jgi:hypothetical protein
MLDKSRLRGGLDRGRSRRARLVRKCFFGKGSLDGRLGDLPGSLSVDYRVLCLGKLLRLGFLAGEG